MAAPMRVGMLNLTGRILLKPIKKTCVLGRFSHVGRTKYSPTSRVPRQVLFGRVIKPPLYSLAGRYMSTEATEATEETDDDYHNIIKNTERAKGPTDKHEFQAETRNLLDIVAKSLYSEKEVFIRELVSNSSDALEKLRYLQLRGDEILDSETPLEIHIAVNEDKKTLTIQDTGIGMTQEELVSNLGTIARSGSKAFMSEIEAGSAESVNKNIIGQFGVGFYSSFMTADKVDVYTRSYHPDSTGYKWSSDGLGSYEVAEAENVQRGTKIVMHLRSDSYDFAKEDQVKEVIKKYSNFVGVPIYVEGKKINVVQALWTQETRDITDDMHNEFYRFISNSMDNPRYNLHYKADAPINIRALFYVPEYKPTLFDMSRETDVAITLYSRKVLIMQKANHILPKWLRFLRGVVDSEDIPLNLSRELLQESALIRKLRWVLSNRIVKFLHENAKRDPERYKGFYEDYGMFIREGIVTTPEQDQRVPIEHMSAATGLLPEQDHREDIAKLLRFESSALSPGEQTNLEDYASRMQAGTRDIYYLNAPSRYLAETSPYMEAMKKSDTEVLFCYEAYDELVLMNLGQYKKKTLKSVESKLVEDKTDDNATTETQADSLSQSQSDELISWITVTLGTKVNKAKLTQRLDTHPCVVTVPEMGAARHFLRTTLADKTPEERYRVLQPTLELNPSHPIIKALHKLRETNPELAKLVIEQLYDNSMIAAGLLDDPRSILGRMNALLTLALEKH